MPILNPYFEDGLGGLPTDWTLVSTSASTAYAGFAFEEETGVGLINHLRGYDNFSFGWFNNSYVTDIPFDVTSFAIFNFPDNPGFIESFEDAWFNGLYLVELSGAVQVPYDFTTGVLGTADDFESNWDNVGYITDLGVSNQADLNTGAGNIDDFENSWGNTAYSFALGVSIDQATFGDPLNGGTAETFEDVLERQLVTNFTVLGHRVVLADNPFNNGDIVTFENAEGGLPSPLMPLVEYTVLDRTATIFSLETSDGTFVIFDGVRPWFGTTYVVADRDIFWVDTV